MLVRISLLLTCLVSVGAFGHSLEAGRINVLVYDGHTEYALKATNLYSTPTRYVVEAYLDDTLSTPATMQAFPSDFILGANQARQLYIVLDDLEGEYVWVCTKTAPTGADMALSTRVCSRATLYHNKR